MTKVTLTIKDKTCSVDVPFDDLDGVELLKLFCGLMHVQTYTPKGVAESLQEVLVEYEDDLG